MRELQREGLPRIILAYETVRFNVYIGGGRIINVSPSHKYNKRAILLRGTSCIVCFSTCQKPEQKHENAQISETPSIHETVLLLVTHRRQRHLHNRL